MFYRWMQELGFFPNVYSMKYEICHHHGATYFILQFLYPNIAGEGRKGVGGTQVVSKFTMKHRKGGCVNFITKHSQGEGECLKEAKFVLHDI